MKAKFETLADGTVVVHLTMEHEHEHQLLTVLAAQTARRQNPMRLTTTGPYTCTLVRQDYRGDE